MFYLFNQNNSGGSFDFDKASGITHYVIVEADTEESAITKAEQIGLYWDGVENGMDCECCGDRWCRYTTGTDTPEIYGKDPSEYIKQKSAIDWMKPNPNVCVHYKDGTKVWY
jgi:hypothetical protein